MKCYCFTTAGADLLPKQLGERLMQLSLRKFFLNSVNQLPVGGELCELAA